MPGGIGILKKALYSYRGKSDALGTNSRIMCSALGLLPDYDNQSVLILNGTCRGQCKDISGVTTGGQVNISGTFSAVITAGISFLILTQKPATAEVAAIEAKIDIIGGIVDAILLDTGTTLDNKLDAIDALVDAVEAKLDDGTTGLAALKAKLDKLAGETPAEDAVTKNWNTAVDSPDGAGGLIIDLGVAATRKKLHSLLLDVSALTDGAAIHVKLFIKINGTQRKVYDETFTIATDPDGLWVVNGTVGLHDVLSVAVYSDNDESVAIGYTAVLEAQ